MEPLWKTFDALSNLVQLQLVESITLPIPKQAIVMPTIIPLVRNDKVAFVSQFFEQRGLI